MPASQTQNHDVLFPMNRLAVKAGRSGGPSLDEIMVTAEAALGRLAQDFISAAEQSIGAMRTCLDGLAESPDPASGLRQVFVACHDLKGQAGTFGYESLGLAAASLSQFLLAQGAYAAERRDVIEVHVNAMGLLLRLGCESEQQSQENRILLAGLENAVYKTAGRSQRPSGAVSHSDCSA